ncbi:MAG: carbon-nitrogen hydrolase family protein [Anaerolineae bacterium]
MHFKVALLQMASTGLDQQANLKKATLFCREAAAQGADLALFPEMWNTGYTINPEAALEPDSAYMTHFRALARELNMALAVTYLEAWTGWPRNTVAIVDRHGESLMTYAKVHTCDFSAECELTPGDDFPVCMLDTAQGSVTLGAMICFDREFPESARVLMLKGAEIILVPNACDLEINRLAQCRARAFENMVGLAMTNYAAPQHNGHSMALDGIAFAPDETSRDMVLVEAGEAEGVYMAVFDLDALRAYRAREVWGNAFRKPHAYRVLVETGVQAPFLRESAR